MKRHAKELQKKSRTHDVQMTDWGWKVVSGSSGKEYAVRETADGGFVCTCKWHDYHPGGECSHVASVRQWLAEIRKRTIYLEDSVEAYRASHRKFEDYNEGVIYTSAKVA